METVCALSVIDDKRGPSGRKMADFVMDGVCFKGLCTFFGTVRQVFVRFSDGWSRKGKVQEYNINLADKSFSYQLRHARLDRASMVHQDQS